MYHFSNKIIIIKDSMEIMNETIKYFSIIPLNMIFYQLNSRPEKKIKEKIFQLMIVFLQIRSVDLYFCIITDWRSLYT